MPTAGSYKIWTADGQGALVDPPDPSDPNRNPYPDPGKAAAVDLYFGIDKGAPQPPPKEQVELHIEIERVLSIVQKLYLAHASRPHARFRRYYVRIFRLAQLGLDGGNASPDMAKVALDKVKQDLIDDEAGRVKNGHLMTLGRAVVACGLPILAGYLLLTLLPVAWLDPWLQKLGILRATAANFCLLWLGCFIGVWLSYGIRTATITLADLTVTDADRLVPSLRLVFAGLMTMLLGMLFTMGIVEIKLGGFAVSQIAEARNATLAFLVGALCGISEAALPEVASKRASTFIASLK